MSNTAKTIIICHNVTKQYNLNKQKTFKEFLPAFFTRRATKTKLNALKSIHFSITRGESLAIIGRNGSGKSTLLKLIAGVTLPTAGELIVNGIVAPLIELGAGFHPELTGKENVYLNGAILGIKKKEMDTLYKKIVEFSALHDFMDQPIKFYSSGMYMRLAFAVAVAKIPDILLLDEILAVGDSDFQKKCFSKIQEFQQKGSTIILVTHNIEQAKRHCRLGLVLHQGEQLFFGRVEQAIALYEKEK
ncbi:MAG TPA: ABC transporter ATP-binding protein [Patescibacteria group bacterium]|nr:ABC transporter ATP-binding protein [Patescibacteria group bacterium]